jgi:hypothetical protein
LAGLDSEAPCHRRHRLDRGHDPDLRAVDHQYGGDACHDAVVAFLSWSRRLLGIEAADGVTGRLQVALADLHHLAGWTAFDTPRLNAARTHLDLALTLARTGRNEGLVANISYRRAVSTCTTTTRPRRWSTSNVNAAIVNPGGICYVAGSATLNTSTVTANTTNLYRQPVPGCIG